MNSTRTPPQSLPLEQAMQRAVGHHQAGRLLDAERLYRVILQAHPHHPDASHNLGVMAVQAGKPAAGIAHFNAALAAHPDRVQYWLNYLDALIRTGREHAARAQRGNAGTLAALTGQPDASLQNAPAREAIHAVARLFAAGQYGEATRLADATLFAEDAAAHFHLGNTLLQLRLRDEALASYRRALEIHPDYAEAHNNLGYVLRELGRLDEAETCCRRSLQLNPGCAEAHNNLGVILHKLERTDEAEKSYRQAMRLKPDYLEAHNNLGRMLHELGRDEEAEAVYRQELRRHPDSAEAHYHLALFLLRSGKFAEGWQEYEHRWEGSLPKVPRPTPPLPQWTGQPPLMDDCLLVYGEQGLGDRLQFSRYLPMASARFSGGVNCIVDPPLQRLFRRSFPQVHILDAPPLEQRGWQCPLLSLPLAFGTTLENLPAQVPYLIPDPARAGYWASRISVLGIGALGPITSTRKIGLVWKTGSGMPNAAERSVRLAQLAPLLDLPGTLAFSLQKEHDPDKAEWTDSGRLVDWTEELIDFDETAALMANMDLVVSVDTSVAHLAGGLGTPVWLLNRKSGEWRWMQGREDSPWYPTMRIFTQKTTDDWDEVIARMAALLRERAV